MQSGEKLIIESVEGSIRRFEFSAILDNLK